MIYGLPRTLQAEAAAELQRRGGRLSWSPAAGVFFSAVFEIPGVFLAMLLGLTISRKANLCFSFISASVFLCGLICALVYNRMEDWGLICTLAVKLFIASAFIVVYLYLLECYPTSFRASGLAFCMVIGRIGAFLCPFLYDAFLLLGAHSSAFFIAMALLLLLGGLLVLFLPMETKEKPLQ